MSFFKSHPVLPAILTWWFKLLSRYPARARVCVCERERERERERVLLFLLVDIPVPGACLCVHECISV
jgi:hypothetical protein